MQHAFVTSYLAESCAVMDAFARDAEAQAVLVAMADAITAAIRAGGKLLIAGNGGSAADAQHFAGEFVSRLVLDRPPLPAIALTVDSSVITGAANDYGYEAVFERQVRGLGRPGDAFLGISTSGRSASVLRALDAARSAGLATLGFTGNGPGASAMADRCDILLRAPSLATGMIQQVHITAAHIVCALVERAIFPAETLANG